ncbi:MAG: DUF2341 domain-containing protein [Candidatus Thorarchaeota archaeon]
MGKSFCLVAIILLFLGMLAIPSFVILTSNSLTVDNKTHDVQGNFGIADTTYWLKGWNYRRAINITGSKGAGSNYQIRITVHYSNGSFQGNDVFCNRLCQPDFGDIRFTRSDGITLLSYWIQNLRPKGNATFWVKVIDNLETSKIIYMYFGTDDYLGTTSSGENTFLLFDDFNESSLDWTNKWASTSQESYAIVEGQLICNAPGVDSGFLYTKYPVSERARVFYKIRVRNTSAYSFYQSFSNQTATIQETASYTLFSSSNDSIQGFHAEIGYGGGGNRSLTWDPCKWATIEMCVDNTYAYVSVLQGLSNWTFTGTNASYGHNTRFWKFLSLSDSIVYIDDLFITKFAHQAPRIVSDTLETYSPSSDITQEPTYIIPNTTSTTSETYLAGGRTLGLIFIVSASLMTVALILYGGMSVFTNINSEHSTRFPNLPDLDGFFEESIVSPYGLVTTQEGQELWTREKHSRVESVSASRTAPRVLATEMTQDQVSGPIDVESGFDTAGEYLKLAIKVTNSGSDQITNVTVFIDVPDGFEFVRKTSRSQKLGRIQPNGFQSAIFWLRPLRCVDGEYTGTVRYVNKNEVIRYVKIPPKRIVNICPMLTATERADEVFARLKSGSLSRNCSSFEFTGEPRVVLHMAEARLSGLVPVDHSEETYDNGVYLGYACYVGQTRYGKYQFAAEMQVTGSTRGGVLTISIYSDDPRILSGFFVDVMYDIREHIVILEERMCPIATCPRCGGSIDLRKVGQDRIFQCEYCGTMGKIAPWLV